MEPLHQIESPVHELLLQQCLKEEELITHRIARKESRIMALHEEIIALYSFFVILNSIIIILLFTASSKQAACRLPWLPCLCSLTCSIVIIWAIRCKTDRQGRLKRLLEREKQDEVLSESMKSEMEFDVLKKMDALRRARSSSVDTKGMARVTSWSLEKDLGMVFLLVVCFLVMGITRFKLCK